MDNLPENDKLPHQEVSPWAQHQIEQEEARRFRWPWKDVNAGTLFVLFFMFAPAALFLWWLLALLFEAIFGSPDTFFE